MAKSRRKKAVHTSEDLLHMAIAMLDELTHGHARASALVAAENLNIALGLLIVRTFTNGDSKAASELMASEKPLGTFSARIKLAYCLGALDHAAYNDLENIRDVRNKCAHHHENLTFADDFIVSKCNELANWEPFREVFSSDEKFLALMGSKSRDRIAQLKFNSVCSYLFMTIMFTLNHMASSEEMSPYVTKLAVSIRSHLTG